MLRELQRFQHHPIWNRLRRRLDWYLAVSTNRMPAKYLICRRIPTELDLKASSEEELWREHERLTQRFLDTWRAIREGRLRLSELPRAKPSLLELSVELARRMLTHCNFCRWNCRVDRTRGVKHGTCQLEAVSRVSSYFHHLGEEFVFRGTRGSGTIFFTSCNMRCSFCQNGDISTDKENGIPVTPQQLALMAWQLRMEGVHNINWVGGEPTIHLHTIVEAISLLDCFRKPDAENLAYVMQAKSDYFMVWHLNPDYAYYEGEFNTPMLWNSNFYFSQETARILRCLIDVWLPDFKMTDKCALKISRTPWYFETVARNHKLVYDWGEDMVIRILIMPGHNECCIKPILRWIAENMPDVPVNLMDQYHPDNLCDPASPKFDPRYAGLARYPTKDEILEAYRYAMELGLNFEPLSYEKSVYGLRAA